MIEQIRNAFSKYSFIGPKDIVSILSVSKIKKVKRGELLLASGDLSYKVFVVLKGLLRNYVISESGDEKTLLFVPEKQSTSAFDCVFYEQPSKEFIEAVENSLLMVFDNRDMEKLTFTRTSLLKLQNKRLKEVLSAAVQRLRNHTVLSPEQRYVNFCEMYPNIEQRVKQIHFASYLGITPTSLSRIKSRIKAKQGYLSKLP